MDRRENVDLRALGQGVAAASDALQRAMVDRDRAIAEAADRGASRAAIAEAAGVSKFRVQQILAQNGATRQYRRRASEVDAAD